MFAFEFYAVLSVATFGFSILVSLAQRWCHRQPLAALVSLHTCDAALYLMEVRDRLKFIYGPTKVLPCGVTAGMIERDVQFVDAAFDDIFQAVHLGRLFRLHFEIDADNVSQDHVMFVVPLTAYVFTLQSYFGVHTCKIDLRPYFWLRQAKRMVCSKDAQLWSRVFDLPEEAEVFEPPVAISCHVSVAKNK